MSVTIICGSPKQGKSTLAKMMFDSTPKEKLVYDVQNAYDGLLPEERRFSPFRTKDFLNFITETDSKGYLSFTDNFVLVEDATAFFSGRISSDFVLAVQSYRHTHNDFVFCFHSVFDVPANLMKFVNMLVVFKTEDTEPQLRGKYPHLWPHVLKAKSPFREKYKPIFLELNPL